MRWSQMISSALASTSFEASTATMAAIHSLDVSFPCSESCNESSPSAPNTSSCGALRALD
jgi:hypothetical protein